MDPKIEFPVAVSVKYEKMMEKKSKENAPSSVIRKTLVSNSDR